jgi:hypothetical protein
VKRSILLECINTAKKRNTPELHNQYEFFAHTSFFIQDNKILGFDVNKGGDPETYLGYGKLRKKHSEREAFKKTRHKLDMNKGFSVINIRLNKKGDLMLSKPCDTCYEFLSDIGCSSVLFSTSQGFAELKFRK